MRSFRYLPAMPALLMAMSAHAGFGDPVGLQSVLWQGNLPSTAPPVAVAMGRDGQSIAVWRDQWLGVPALLSQRFSPDGGAIGTTQAFTQFAGLNEGFGKVVATISQNGTATIAWESSSAADPGDIHAIRIGTDGLPLGPIVVVNTTTAGMQSLPSIASDSLDHALITWTSPIDSSTHGVFAQLFNGWGGFQFGEFRVDESAASAPIQSVALLGNCCNVAVAWQAQTAADQLIYARAFSLGGQAWTPEQSLLRWPAVSGPFKLAGDMDFSGMSRLAWSDAQGYIHSMAFDASLQTVGSVTTSVPQYPPDAGSPLWMGLAHDGSGTLAWRHDDGFNVRNVLSAFDANGNTLTEALILPSDGPNQSTLRALAVDADGDPLMSWSVGGPFAWEQSLHISRFSGQPHAMYAIDTWFAPNAVESGASFSINVPMENLVNPDSRSAAIGLLTGVEFEIDLDDALTLQGYTAQNGWGCKASTVIYCRKDAVLARSTEFPVVLTVTAPAGRRTLHNQFTVRALEPALFPEFGQVTQTIEVGDRVPAAFAFVDQIDVPLNSMIVSAPLAPVGFDTPTGIEVSSGEYSINGGPFVTGAGVLNPGDSVRVRHGSAATFSTARNTVLSIGGVSDTFTSTTLASDTTPDPFAFNALSDVPRSTLQLSNAITVGGINAATQISVGGGEYRINGGNFTSANGTVVAGDVVVLRHLSSSSFSTATNTTLKIGGVSASFVSTTEALDSTPDPFAFIDQGNLATAIMVTSAPITVAGINAPAAISIVGGSYSINGGNFTKVAGSVSAGDQVRVQVLSADSALTVSNTVLTIGGVSDTFSATTGSIDTTPAAFTFTDVSNARRGKTVISEAVTIGKFNAPVAITVSGGGGTIKWSKNGGTFTAAQGTVVSGDQIRLQMVSSDLINTQIDATVTIGGVSDVWSVSTGTR